MTDEQIVDLYLARNEDAVRETSYKYGKRLRDFAKGITEDAGSAEECENDTYMQAWNSIPPQEPRDYLFNYLVCITRHLALNICRSRHTLKRSAYITELSSELQECLPSEHSDNWVNDMALKEALNSFLADLDAKKRNMFVRRYFFADTVTDISKTFGISESNAKVTLMRLREKFKEVLKESDIM
jgi:RNA polymerase sigma-70 factor (ECF subfamily)